MPNQHQIAGKDTAEEVGDRALQSLPHGTHHSNSTRQEAKTPTSPHQASLHGACLSPSTFSKHLPSPSQQCVATPSLPIHAPIQTSTRGRPAALYIINCSAYRTPSIIRYHTKTATRSRCQIAACRIAEMLL